MQIKNMALALSFCTFLVLGCKEKPQQEPAPVTPNNPNVVTISPELAGGLKIGKPQLSDITGDLRVAAHVETDARRITRVGSPVAGRILNLLAFEGQVVQRGTVLAILHSTDLSDTQVALIKAESQRGLAAASVKRAEQLVQADVIGRAELERRRAEEVQATTEVDSYRTQLKGLGMTEQQIRKIQSSHKLSADYPIVAPRSGIVLKRDVTIGQVVQPADSVFTIADLSSVWIIANVPEEDAGNLKQGMRVSVLLPALPQEKIVGTLSYVSPIVDPATRTVAVRMDVANPNGLLKPDELASMAFLGQEDKALTVPNTAVVREDNQDHIFVQTRSNEFVLRDVTLGKEENDRRVVLKGVTEEETIVTDGAFHLNNQRKQSSVTGGQ